MACRAFVEAGALPQGADALPCTTVDEVFEAVDRGRAAFGVVPIENSLEGPVTTTLDAFAFSSRAEILGELVLDIHQALLLAPGAGLDGVATVASHPQGIGQCRRWLAAHLPGRAVRLVDSTAAAAELAARDATVAAIASPLAAQVAGAQVFAEAIEDNLSSQTRFVLVGDGPAPRAKTGKTTLALFINSDRPGTLNMILSELAYGNINMSMVQSRPTKRELGDYMFFIDIDGYADEPDIACALNCLRMKLREVKVIGSYPRYRDAS